MKLREIMTADVVTAAPDTTLEEIAIMMRDDETGAVPVLDEQELVGVITDRDLVIRGIAEGKDPSEATAAEILSEDLETVEPDDDVEEASRLMAQKQVRRLPVVEDGRLVGMVSLGDIAVKSGQQQAASTLEKVSHGVKPSRRPPRSARPASAPEPGRHTAISAAERLDQERGETTLPSGGRNARQGIANRSVEEEQGRQRKVVPIRNGGKQARKRRAS
jgi:CBS domain-containing protein